jgi:uncharacterized protein YbjT (DUF2867 family)
MVGSAVLLECLESAAVESVLVVTRAPTGRVHPKLQEIVHADFWSYDALRPQFAGVDACYFCLGVSSIGMAEDRYTRLTFDLTLAAARVLQDVSPGAVFCYVSGVGTDSSERSAVMWSRVKGRTENALLALGFRAAYMFRPGYIQPVKGARSKTGWVNAAYTVLAPLTTVLVAVLPRYILTSAMIGQAMIQVTTEGYETPVLEPRDIIRAARRRQA